MGLFTKTNESEKDAVKVAKATDTKKATKKAPKKESMKELYSGTKTTAKKTGDKKKDAVKNNGVAYKVLVKPLITEKAADLGTHDKYVFEVAVDSNKIDVEKAISEVYGVKPVSVNMVNMQGKVKRRGRTMGKRKDWKKAIITLPKGSSINIYEGV